MAKVAHKITLSPRYKGELKNQIAGIAERNLSATEAAEKRVRVAVRRLARFPDLGRPGRVEGTRELSVYRTPFIVAYRVLGDAIEVLALRHAKQDWPKSF